MDVFGRKRPARSMHQGGGGDRGPREAGSWNMDDRLNDKIAQLSGPTFELPPVDMSEKKYSGRSRLYLGNIPSDMTVVDIIELFRPFGECGEMFINGDKNFAFVRLDFHANAEKAKGELDGTAFKGRNLKIRFAPNGSSIKVTNLSHFVSNELLYYAFSAFGEIERCTVLVDDRGKSTGEGIVEFAKKGHAMLAIRKCSENCFFLTGSLQPVLCEMHEAMDDTDGYPDRNIPKKNADYTKARKVGPRFANVNSFENEFGMRWKRLYELYAQKDQALKKELETEKEKLEAEMEYARYEHETDMLRDRLRAREMDRDRQKREWEMKERQVEEARQRSEDLMRGEEEELEIRIIYQGPDELQRRQDENNLYMQADHLGSFEGPGQPIYNSNASDLGPGNANMDPQTFLNPYDRNYRFDGQDMGQHGPRSAGSRGGRGPWAHENRGDNGGGNRDDYLLKRRRF